MAINRNYSYNPVNYPPSVGNSRRNPSVFTVGASSAFDVGATGAVGGCGAANGVTNPAADQTFMPTNLAADATGQPSAMQLISTIVSTLISIIQSLGAGSTTTGGQRSAFASGDGQYNPADTTNNDFTDPGTVTEGNGAPTGVINGTTNPNQKATLDQSLSKIASDPDGSKLIAQAKKLGVTIKVGDPAAAAAGAGARDQTVVECPFCQQAAKLQAAGDVQGAAKIRAQDTRDAGQSVAKDGTVQVNGVTLSDNKTGQVTVVVRDPSNIKTIAHELVHAVSTQDGNSQQEEGIADVIGSRVANNVGDSKDAVQGTDEQIYINKQQYYPTLNNSNNIRQTLAALGINVSV